MPPFFTLRHVVSQTRARPADVLNVKRALNRMGFYDVPDYGMTPYADRTMFDGIRRFQRANGLRVDGVMQRGHATERAMNDALRLAHKRRPCMGTRANLESEINVAKNRIENYKYDLEIAKFAGNEVGISRIEKRIRDETSRLEFLLRELQRCYGG